MLLSNKALAMMSRTLSHCARREKRNWLRFYIICINLEAGLVYGYRGEDETLGPRVSHLNLL